MNARRSFLASLALIPAAAVAAFKPSKPVGRFRMVAEIPPEAGGVTSMCVFGNRVVVACKNSIWVYEPEQVK